MTEDHGSIMGRLEVCYGEARVWFKLPLQEVSGGAQRRRSSDLAETLRLSFLIYASTSIGYDQ